MKRRFSRMATWTTLMVVGVVAMPQAANPEPQERHPRIRAAIRELEGARQELRTAAHDFCGHRAEAIEKTDQAIRQLQMALACDRR
ncbi:MAG TPA: hypothetical protein VGF59_05390 [Bryobacteraceae bacterium]